MPGCVLRVSGSDKKIRKFLSASPFDPSAVFYKGERRFPKDKRVRKQSGFNLVLSGSEGLPKQAEGAARFIKRNKEEFDRMKSFGLKSVTIDFGLYDIAAEEHPWPTYQLPAKLVKLAAEYNFKIELSFYGEA